MIITQEKRQRQGGNVLFLILIAVALFAALSYVVTQSTRSGGGSTEREKNILSSAQMTQYPTALRTALIRLVLSGVSVEQVRFNPPSDPGATPGIEVFLPSGGGATYMQAPSELMDGGTSVGTWTYNGEYEVPSIGAAGSGGNDVIAFLPDVSTGVCKQVNEELGINTTGCTMTAGVPNFAAGAGIDTSLTAAVVFPTADMTDIVGAGCADAFRGQASGCFYDTTGSRNVFFSVLLER